MSEIKTELTSRINSVTGGTIVLVKVSCGENILAKEVSGFFLDYRVRKTVERFKKTLRDCIESLADE